MVLPLFRRRSVTKYTSLYTKCVWWKGVGIGASTKRVAELLRIKLRDDFIRHAHANIRGNFPVNVARNLKNTLNFLLSREGFLILRWYPINCLFGDGKTRKIAAPFSLVDQSDEAIMWYVSYTKLRRIFTITTTLLFGAGCQRFLGLRFVEKGVWSSQSDESYALCRVRRFDF